MELNQRDSRGNDRCGAICAIKPRSAGDFYVRRHGTPYDTVQFLPPDCGTVLLGASAGEKVETLGVICGFYTGVAARGSCVLASTEIQRNGIASTLSFVWICLVYCDCRHCHIRMGLQCVRVKGFWRCLLTRQSNTDAKNAPLISHVSKHGETQAIQVCRWERREGRRIRNGHRTLRKNSPSHQGN